MKNSSPNSSMRSTTKTQHHRLRRKSDSCAGHRMACKQCADCSEWVPVACHSCACGYNFPLRSKSTSSIQKTKVISPSKGTPPQPPPLSDTEEDSNVRKRGKRKVGKPKFFNPGNIVQTPRRPRQRNESQSRTATESPLKKNRAKQKSVTEKAREDIEKPASTPEPEENLFAKIPQEKAFQYAIILAEINRKVSATTFKPS